MRSVKYSFPGLLALRVSSGKLRGIFGESSGNLVFSSGNRSSPVSRFVKRRISCSVGRGGFPPGGPRSQIKSPLRGTFGESSGNLRGIFGEPSGNRPLGEIIRGLPGTTLRLRGIPSGIFGETWFSLRGIFGETLPGQIIKITLFKIPSRFFYIYHISIL